MSDQHNQLLPSVKCDMSDQDNQLLTSGKHDINDQNDDHTDVELTPLAEHKREQMILALLEHPTMEKAARAVGVSCVTMWRYMRNPDFHEKYLIARREVYCQSMARLQQASGLAVSTLMRVLVDREASYGNKIRAATAMLDHGAHSLELEDLSVRLSKIEQFQAQKKT